MNENLNLVEILKDCPEGTKLYSTIYGDVEFVKVRRSYYIDFPIEIKLSDNSINNVTRDGKLFVNYSGECTLFPSKDQRDWNKFKTKKPKFDPKTLQPFDKVLVRDSKVDYWCCDLFSNFINVDGICQYLCVGSVFKCCIHYNDDTKHLVGTDKEALELYRYWED